MSLKEENENYLKANGTHHNTNVFDKTEIFASEETAGLKKYTVRADRMYRAECRSNGSRPRSTIEWYLLEKNQRYNVGQSKTSVDTADSPSSSTMVSLGEKRAAGTSLVLEGKISGIVETQQVSDRLLYYKGVSCAIL